MDENTKRVEVIQNLIASIAVLTWSLDLEMSAAILDATAKKFGDKYTGDLMNEVALALNGAGGNTEKDLCTAVAALTFVGPLPSTWSETIH